VRADTIAVMAAEHEHAGPESARETAILRELGRSREAFQRFLERRVGDREVAADLLQDAFVRGLAHAGELRDAESAVAWFYRLLRNAAADHFRRRGGAPAELGALADELADPGAAPRPLHAQVCRCVGELARTLPPEFAAAIQRIDVDGLAVNTFAAEAGITSANAAQRVRRARTALRSQVERACRTCAAHGCVDCSCRATERGAE